MFNHGVSSSFFPFFLSFGAIGQVASNGDPTGSAQDCGAYDHPAVGSGLLQSPLQHEDRAPDGTPGTRRSFGGTTKAEMVWVTADG